MAAHSKPFPPLQPAAQKAGARKQPHRITRKSLPKPFSKGKPVAAAKAKAHFLQLLDEVDRKGEVITITKRGRIVAQLVPAPQEGQVSNFDRVFGSMAGTGRIVGDIVSPDWEAWGPEWR